MPVYLTQWRDGDCSITVAETREEAHAAFQQVACLEMQSIAELQADRLTLTITLADDGNVVIKEYDSAIEEVRQLCYPDVIEALQGRHPDVLDPEQRGKRLRREARERK
jgi:hypothetical protein